MLRPDERERLLDARPDLRRVDGGVLEAEGDLVRRRDDEADAVDERPRWLWRTRAQSAPVAAGLHRLGEVQPALERAGEERRELPHGAELDAAPAQCNPQVARVALEERHEAS